MGSADQRPGHAGPRSSKGSGEERRSDVAQEFFRSGARRRGIEPIVGGGQTGRIVLGTACSVDARHDIRKIEGAERSSHCSLSQFAKGCSGCCGKFEGENASNFCVCDDILFFHIFSPLLAKTS